MMTNTMTAPGHHINLSGRYGCRAWMTVATFVAHGIVHRARQFFRSDMTDTGKIELYTIAPYPGTEITTMTEAGWYESTMSEDWLGYADESSTVGRLAAAVLNAVGSGVSADQSERFAAMELV